MMEMVVFSFLHTRHTVVMVVGVHTYQVCESKQVMGAVSDHTRWDQVGEKL